MAANARAFGYCFNPISVFWCHRRGGELAGVVVEVHNTYGDRHAYLVHPDEQGRARTDKQMYVSPFHGTDGYYEIAVPRPGERLHVSVTLHSSDGRSDEALFSASLDGTATPISPWRSAPAALRGALLIRAHGIWLWARRLGIRPRPDHPDRKASDDDDALPPTSLAWAGLDTYPRGPRPTSPPASLGSCSGPPCAGCRSPWTRAPPTPGASAPAAR